MTQRDKWANRPVVVKYFEFANRLRREIKVPSDVYGVTLKFYVPMPKYWSKKKKERYVFSPHQQRPDLDNYCKSFLDALFKEDKYIYRIDAEKHWDYEGSIDFMLHTKT